MGAKLLLKSLNFFVKLKYFFNFYKSFHAIYLIKVLFAFNLLRKLQKLQNDIYKNQGTKEFSAHE